MALTSPTPRRQAAGRLLAAAGAAAAAAALALPAMLPASADSAPSTAPSGIGEGSAQARIATVDWCGDGPIGEVATAEGDAHEDTGADWTADPRDVAGDRHFAVEPADAYSSVAREDSGLTAAAGVDDVRFAPACPDDSESSPTTPVAEAFGRDTLLALDSADSTASWSSASGPRAHIDVSGLEILGEPADVSEGRYSDTFTTDSGDDEITVAVSVERGLRQPSDSSSRPSGDTGARHAAASLSVDFEVTRRDAQGDTVSGFDTAVEFAGAAVDVPDSGASPSDTPTPDGSPDPTPGPTTPEQDGPGSTSESATASGDTPSGDATDSPHASQSPGAPGGADDRSGEPSATPDPGGTGPAPTQQDPAPGPTVAAPTGPQDAPSVRPGDDTRAPDPDDDGRLPVAGSTLIGLVATGLAAIGGGGTAIYLGRGRKSGFDGDDIAAQHAHTVRSEADWP